MGCTHLMPSLSADNSESGDHSSSIGVPHENQRDMFSDFQGIKDVFHIGNVIIVPDHFRIPLLGPAIPAGGTDERVSLLLHITKILHFFIVKDPSKCASPGSVEADDHSFFATQIGVDQAHGLVVNKLRRILCRPYLPLEVGSSEA